MEEKKTAYEWLLSFKYRVLSPLDVFGGEDAYMLKKLTQDEFNYLIMDTKLKSNSTPRKPEKYLELRMYGFVPYNISEIQKGIQFGHAVVEYGMKYMNTPEYQYFANEWKTFMILNGGTSNDGSLHRHGFKDIDYKGSLNLIADSLFENDINYHFFREPDLNDMLTAVVFLVDERVFNKELYPDYVQEIPSWYGTTPTPIELEDWEKYNAKNYAAWVVKIGGPKNVFLRELLKNKCFA